MSYLLQHIPVTVMKDTWAPTPHYTGMYCTVQNIACLKSFYLVQILCWKKIIKVKIISYMKSIAK